MARLRVRSLSKSFRRDGLSIAALAGVDFSLEAGRWCAVSGPNGAGKTTLLKILAGLVLPDGGEVRLDDRPQAKWGRSWGSRVGAAFAESPGFYDRLTGAENLEFFGALHGLSAGAVRRRLDGFGSWLNPESLSRRWQEASAGARQALTLARAFLHEPDLLLLDEPTRSLDAGRAAAVHAFLSVYAAAHPQAVFLIATHRPEEAARAGQLLRLDAGRLKPAGSGA